jgi:hypothetical protein
MRRAWTNRREVSRDRHILRPPSFSPVDGVFLSRKKGFSEMHRFHHKRLALAGLAVLLVAAAALAGQSTAGPHGWWTVP